MLGKLLMEIVGMILVRRKTSASGQLSPSCVIVDFPLLGEADIVGHAA